MAPRNYEIAADTLKQLWDERDYGLPNDLAAAVARLVWSKQTAARYGIVTQLLLKAAYPGVSALQLSDFERAPFPSARSLCKNVVVPWNVGAGEPLGDSKDPYVSNPLRDKQMIAGATGDLGLLEDLLLKVENGVDAAAALRHALAVVEGRRPTIGNAIRAGFAAQADWRDGADGASERRRAVIEGFFPGVIKKLVDGADSKGGSKQGSDAEVPWVGVFVDGNKPSAKTGHYPCYLFSADGEKCYLSVQVATEGRKISAVRSDVAEFRSSVPTDVAYLVDDLDLRSSQGSGSRPKRYEAASVAALEYVAGELPDEEQLRRDLVSIVGASRSLAATESSAPEVEVEVRGETSVDIEGVSLADVCSAFGQAVRESGLDYGERHDELVRVFVVSLATKGFVLLTGLSGSGKTRMALAFGQWLGEGRRRSIAVRPDWTGPEYLLGYPNGLSPVDEKGRAEWVVPRALELVLEAQSQVAVPHLLLLDEMNLAHVERYFADVLSGMESREPIVPQLAKIDGRWREVGKPLPLPTNLFVVGTVNIDETTYMFSPKVLDRANALEFRVLEADLRANSAALAEVATGDPAHIGRFLHDANAPTAPSAATDQAAGALRELHGLLAEADREFGHRVFAEALRFGALWEEAGGNGWLEALDFQVLQKILPRIHGSTKQVLGILQKLGWWCSVGPASGLQQPAGFDITTRDQGDEQLPRSYDKIKRMTRKLLMHGFVSFAE